MKGNDGREGAEQEAGARCSVVLDNETMVSVGREIAQAFRNDNEDVSYLVVPPKASAYHRVHSMCDHVAIG